MLTWKKQSAMAEQGTQDEEALEGAPGPVPKEQLPRVEVPPPPGGLSFSSPPSPIDKGIQQRERERYTCAKPRALAYVCIYIYIYIRKHEYICIFIHYIILCFFLFER